MPQTIVRRVIINERDFPKMQHRCLVRSEFGNEKLYDTCEWRPITTHDLLIDLLKQSRPGNGIESYLSNHALRFYDRMYLREYKFYWNCDSTLIGRKKHSRHYYQFGWATVTKYKP